MGFRNIVKPLNKEERYEKINPSAKIYGGLDLVLLSDGEAEVELKGNGASGDNDLDIERDDILNLRFGGVIGVGKMSLRPELTLMNDKTLVFSAMSYF